MPITIIASLLFPARGPYGCFPSALGREGWLCSSEDYRYRDGIKPPHPQPPLPTLMSPLFRFRALRRGESSPVRGHPSPQSLHRPPAPPLLEGRSLPIPEMNDISLSRRYTQDVHDLQLSLPSGCRRLGPEDFVIVGRHPMAAGESAEIWAGTLDGRKVVLKSHRHCRSSDVGQVVTVCYNHSLCQGCC